VVFEGDEPGGKRCAVWTAGSETTMKRCISSVAGDKRGEVAVVQSETGTELGSSEPAVAMREVGQGSDQAHQPCSDVSVPE
jgi:hypothetical protein